jgi:sigma-B regulation protein RsbU (phosphoserine phosphatase)
LALWHVHRQVVVLPRLVTTELLRVACAVGKTRLDANALQAVLDEPADVPEGMLAALRDLRDDPPYFDERGFQRNFDRRPLAPPYRSYPKSVFLIVTDGEAAPLVVSCEPDEPVDWFVPTADGDFDPSATELTSSREYVRARGETYVAAYLPLTDRGPRRVFLAMAIHGEQLRSLGAPITWEATALFVIAALASIVPAWYFSAKLNRPLGRLCQAMQAAGEGRLETRLPPPRTGDEFEAAFEEFNDMVAGLAERDRMKQSLSLAMEIQQNLLPAQSPELPGVRISAQSDYCDETGGDYYDFIDLVELPGRKLGIAVGDITGHGIAAALLMASARAVLRSQAAMHGEDIPSLLTEMNRSLARDAGGGRFMTLFYGVLDAEDRTLRYCSAGHDPAMWLRARTGEFCELPNTGLPLGVLDEATYSLSGPHVIEDDDLLIIGTDGIWEAPDPQGDLYGKDRLRTLVLQARDDEPDTVRQRILDDVRRFQRNRAQRDDITVVVLKGVPCPVEAVDSR